jgi:hypothetical protein
MMQRKKKKNEMIGYTKCAFVTTYRLVCYRRDYNAYGG